MGFRVNTMYNSDIPSRAELPSSRQLIRSTIIAAVSAAVLLYTVVLPSEYGVDPTGIGRVLGLTEMGEIKIRLAKEAADDAAATQASQSEPTAAAGAGKPAVQSAPVASSAATWRDEMTFTLAPGQGTEIKRRSREEAGRDR